MQKMNITKKQPVKKRLPAQESETQIQLEEYRIFKRNRWIFLACTLGICIIVVAVLSIQCKQECDKQIAEYNDPQKFEEAKLLHDALFLKYDLYYSIEAFVKKYSLYNFRNPSEEARKREILLYVQYRKHHEMIEESKKREKRNQEMGIVSQQPPVAPPPPPPLPDVDEAFTERCSEMIADCERLFKLHEDFVAAAKKYNQLAQKLEKETIKKDADYELDKYFIERLEGKYKRYKAK